MAAREGGVVAVADVGGHRVKVGYAGEAYPCVQCPATYVDAPTGHAFGHGALLWGGGAYRNPYEGDGGATRDAADPAGVDWAAWGGLLRYAVGELHERVGELALVVPAWVGREHLDYEDCIREAVFSALPHVHRLITVPSPTAVCLAAGVAHGIVVDVGHRTASVTPVADLTVRSGAAVRTPYAGAAMTAEVAEVLPASFTDCFVTAEGYWLNEAYRGVKEAVAQATVVKDTDETPTPYTLPDGQDVFLAPAAIERVASGLFRTLPEEAGGMKWHQLGNRPTVPVCAVQSHRVEQPALSLADMIYASVSRLPATPLACACSGVFTAGGGSTIPGFDARLAFDLSQRHTKPPPVVYGRSEEQRLFAAWQGGSILAGWPQVHSFCITRSEWEDGGS